MAKASFTLPDGTTVDVEGSPEEIRKIVSLHQHPIEPSGEQPARHKSRAKSEPKQELERNESHLAELVNKTKDSREFGQIEKAILDRSSVVDRLLLPLYIEHEYFSDRAPLTSGDMSKYLSQLSVNIAQPNIAKNLSSSASRYVIGNRIRKPGAPVRYRISRKGLAYLKSVIRGKLDD